MSDSRPLLFLVSENQHKLLEVSELVGNHFRVTSAVRQFPGLVLGVEDGLTFRANALKKLAPAFALTGRGWFAAEDSGLCCAGIGGLPGITSARFAGPGGGDPERRTKLLARLKNDRAAFFITSLAVLDPKGRVLFFEGRAHGDITREEHGEGGFGYDPLFRPWGQGRTYGEMSATEKNRFSHRARAFQALVQFLKTTCHERSEAR